MLTDQQLIEALDLFLKEFKCFQSEDMVAKNITSIDQQHSFKQIEAFLKKEKLDHYFTLKAPEATKINPKTGQFYTNCSLFSKFGTSLKNFAKGAKGNLQENATYKQNVLNNGVF